MLLAKSFITHIHQQYTLCIVSCVTNPHNNGGITTLILLVSLCMSHVCHSPSYGPLWINWKLGRGFNVKQNKGLQTEFIVSFKSGIIAC